MVVGIHRQSQRSLEVPDLRRVMRRLSEDEILQKSSITDEDLARARAWWKTHAPTHLRALVDAEPKVQKSGD